MAKRYALSVHDMNRKKLYDLYDSTNPVEGEAFDVEITKEKNGWKEIHFSVPCFLSSGEENIRCQYIQNELLVRLVEGNDEDWYTIVTPKDVHNSRAVDIEVVCEHVSGMLKTRNLFGYFDDTNGIDTCQAQCEKALNGTGWVLKTYDTFYESDGRTEKIRSYSCDEKTGAWEMIQEICDLFKAYPIFDGDTQEMHIRSRLNHEGLVEIAFGKNTESVERERDTTALVTRLYVQGDYTDNGYVGIDDAKENTLHLNFICNFDYYRELGLFTAEHEAALKKYLNTKSTNAQETLKKMEEQLKKEREFGDTIGTCPTIYYELAAGVVLKRYTVNSPEEKYLELTKGDKLAAIKMSGDTCVSYEYVDFDQLNMIPEGTNWLAKFVGTINGRLMTAENFINTSETALKNLQDKQDKLNKDKEEQEDPSVRPKDDEISESEKQIEKLKSQLEEYRKQTLVDMAQGIKLMKEIISIEGQIEQLKKDADECEKEFAKAMGVMLRDGYWSSDQYIPGQEDALYTDALDISKEMAHPQYKWTVEIKDLSFREGWEEEAFNVNQTLRIYDEVLGLKQYAYVESHTINPRQEWKNTVTISTDELGLASRTLANILTRITDMAQLLKDSAAIFKRAATLGEDGSQAAQFLEGMIDISRNKILSVGSNWYTDERGNIVFVALDDSSAMMLTGMGFMVANGKNEKGEWNWRTFGTGDGFTADLITTGFLSAERIRAESITANHLAADVGKSLDLSSNQSIVMKVHDSMNDVMNETIQGMEIGGTNLVDDSRSRQQLGINANTYWVAADELEPNTQYTLSIKEVIKNSGTAAGATWEIVNANSGRAEPHGLLEFTRGKQIVHFTTPPDAGNQALYLYAGEKGSTMNVSVTFNYVKLEAGMVATAWSPSPEDTSNSIGELSGLIQGQEQSIDPRIDEWVRKFGFATRGELAEALKNLNVEGIVTSAITQYGDSVKAEFSRLNELDGKLVEIETRIQYGAEVDGTPYIDMSTNASGMKMRLTNTRLSFMQGSNELAYFSDNKLYVTKMEAVEQISIGSSVNGGFLDIITTPSGVGLKWRNAN